MASPNHWTWVCAGFRSWWWTGKPGMLQSMGLQSQTRLSNWTELSWTWGYTNAGLLPSGTVVFWTFGSPGKQEALQAFTAGNWLQVMEELRQQQRAVLARSLYQPPGWRDWRSLSRGWWTQVEHGGSVLGLEPWRRPSCCQRMSLRQIIRERNALTNPCFPHQYCISAYCCLYPGSSQLTRRPGEGNLQGPVPLRSSEGQGMD